MNTKPNAVHGTAAPQNAGAQMLDLDAIRARIADCSTYNFGMRNANTLAKEDAPALVAEVERLQGIVDRVRESVHAVRHALHLTGDLDAREVLQHITTAMETE